MGKLTWHKREHAAALEETAKMTLEESGAYFKIIDLIYSHDGRLADESGFICRWLNCDARVWKRLKARLIQLGKLFVRDGELHIEVIDKAIDTALAKLAAMAELGRSGGSKSKKNNDLPQADSAGDKKIQKNQSQDSPDVGVPSPAGEAGQARQRAGRAASDRPEFEVWFDRYPKQTGRDAAAEEYRKARRRVSAAKLLEGLEAAIARWTEAGTEARFIPDPANWLRAGRWDDKPPVAPQLELPVLSAVPGAPETFPARCRRLGRETPWLAQHHHELAEAMQDHDAGRLTDDHLLACFCRVDAGLSARSIRRVALTA